MVKKKLDDDFGGINIDDIDKEFSIDDFNIDDLDVSGRDPSKNTKKNKLSTIAKFVDVKSFTKGALSKILPEEYATTLDSINGNIDLANDLYDKTTAPLRKSIQQNNRTLRELEPIVSRYFGKKVGSKYSNFVDSNTPYTFSNDDSGEDNTVNATLSEIFDKQQKTDEDRRKEDVAAQLIRDRREDLRFNRSFSVSKGIYDVNKRLLDYQEQVDYKYKKKSIELQVRTYVELKKHHMLAAANMNDTSRFLKQLVHNSTLPDIQKMRISEQAKGMFREKLIGTAQAIPAQFASNYLKSIAGNLGDKLGNTSDTLLGLVGDVLDGSTTMKDMGNNNSDILAQFLAPLVNKFVGSKVGGWIGRKTGIRDSKSLKNAFNKTTYLSNNFQKILADKLQNSTGLLGVLGNLGTDEGLRLSVRRDTLANSTEATVYDNASRKSLVEIIPGLLSRILQSTEGIRTGTTSSMTVFDHERNEFTNENELVKRTMSDFKNDPSLRDMQSKVDDIITKLVGNKRVSGRAKTALKKEIYRLLINGKMFSPEKLANTNNYKEKLDDKTASEIQQLLSGFNTPDALSKDFWTSDSNTDLLEIDKMYNSAMGSHPDLVQRARMLDSVGQKDMVNRIGLLNESGDVDVDKLIAFYSGKGRIRNGQRKSRSLGGIPNGRYGSDINYARPLYDNQRYNESDYSNASESNEILKDIRDAMASAQEIKDKILTVEEEIRTITNNIYEYLPQINSVSYNISGDELAEKFYSNIKNDVNHRFGKIGKGIRSGSRKLFGVLKSPFTMFGHGVTKVKDALSDVYVKGRDGVALYASKLREGKYFDQATGKVIKKLSDIKGAVVDEFGNVVLTLEDIKAGLFDSRGRKIANSILGSIKNASSWVAGKFNALNPVLQISRLLGKIKNRFVDWWVDESMDVYVVGETSPRLLKIIFQNRGYFSKKTGRVLTGADKIDGEVVDKEGNVILSNDDIKKGLCDKYGKSLKFGISKYLSRALGMANNLIVKPIKGAAKLVSKGIKTAYKGMAALGRFIFGTKFSEAAADRALPQDASLEARYLNRIYYFLRATFGGAVNGAFNKVHQATRRAGSGIGRFFGAVKDRVKGFGSAASRARNRLREEMEDKMEKYRYKRFFKKVKDDKIKDEENRKNSWRWKMKNKTKASNPKQAKKAAIKKFGWLKWVLGGIVSLGWFMFKKLSSAFWSVGKWITKGLGGLLKPLMGGVGNLAMGALKAGGRMLGSVAGWAARGMISAGAAILTNPVGLAIGAIALVAVGGYLAYKWWSGRLKPLQKYRYAQYGADTKNDDIMEQIAAAEKYFYEHLSFGAVGKPPIMSKDFDPKYFAQLCGCQLGDQNDQQTRWWCSWFDRRFVPVATRWAMTMQEYQGTKPFYDADKLLKDSQKVGFALKVAFDITDPNCPYNLRGGPNPFFPTTVGNGMVMQFLTEIRNEYIEDVPKSEQGEIKIDEMLASPIKSDWKFVGVETVKGWKQEDIKVDLTVSDKSMLVDENNYNEIQLDESVVKNQETSESATPFTWVRLLCYGLPVELMNQAKWVNKLLSLEMLIIRDCISYKGGKVQFVAVNNTKYGGGSSVKTEWGFNQYVVDRAKLLLGWSPDTSMSDLKKLGNFLSRFLAVFGHYLALANNQCPGINIFDVYKQRNDVLYPIAKELASSTLGQGIIFRPANSEIPRDAFNKTPRWPIWNVTGEITPGYALNTDYKTVNTYLESLDPENNKTTGVLKASDEGSSSDNDDNAAFRDKYGIGSGGGISYDQLKSMGSDSSNGEDISGQNTNSTVMNPPSEPQPDIINPAQSQGGWDVFNPTPSFPGQSQDNSGIPPLLRRPDTEPSGDPTYGEPDENAIDPSGNPMPNLGNVPSQSGGVIPAGNYGKNGTFLPTPNNVVTSLFGMRKLPEERQARMHNGIDLRAGHGDKIRAFQDGVVVGNWNAGKYGDITIEHSKEFTTRYLHCSPESAKYIKPGMRVKAGQIIGEAGGYGKKGNYTYDPHLHFETIYNKKKVNPLNYLLNSGFDLREKLEGGKTARIDRPYQQEDRRSPGYMKSRLATDTMLANRRKTVEEAERVAAVTPQQSKVNQPVGNMPPAPVDATSDVPPEIQTAGNTAPPFPDTNASGIPTENSSKETGGDDTGLFYNSGVTSDAIRTANTRKVGDSLLDTNQILVSNLDINKMILDELKGMNTKVGKLVDTSDSVAKIMVGGKEVELKQTGSQMSEKTSANDAPTQITRRKASDAYVSFSKKAV